MSRIWMFSCAMTDKLLLITFTMLLNLMAGLFDRWILLSTGYITNQWVAWFVFVNTYLLDRDLSIWYHCSDFIQLGPELSYWTGVLNLSMELTKFISFGSIAGSCVTSDTRIIRDIFYNGNPIREKCTIILRIAPTFLRLAVCCIGPSSSLSLIFLSLNYISVLIFFVLRQGLVLLRFLSQQTPWLVVKVQVCIVQIFLANFLTILWKHFSHR